jgi:hypothetical protein
MPGFPAAIEVGQLGHQQIRAIQWTHLLMPLNLRLRSPFSIKAD